MLANYLASLADTGAAIGVDTALTSGHTAAGQLAILGSVMTPTELWL